MISSDEAADLAVDEIKNMWTRVWSEVHEGYLLTAGFQFATVDLFWKFQKAVKSDKTMHGIRFGSSYGPYPRKVTTYFPQFKDKYPVHKFNVSHGDWRKQEIRFKKQQEIRAIKQAQRQKKRLEEDAPYVPL